MGNDAAGPQVLRVLDTVRDEMRRADTKAQMLLSLVGAALAGMIALTSRNMSAVAQVTTWLAAAPMFTSVLLLLSAIRPRLPKPTPGSWLHTVHNGPEKLLALDEDVAARHLADDIVVIGSIARTKYRCISRAIVLLIIGLSALGLSLVLQALT
ncbi:Pycsar system effector family protein [Amycolatopsis sp. NPDC052450]|uniref:Pycsar system effector family protein n=1 Tax=Amycolatopsis sp. NPDC052450 TaxID=3363937 RepID=UPI0037CAEECA